MSEPSYSLVRNRRELFTAKPQQVMDYLRARKIKYFCLNLETRLFSTFAFTTLFDTHELARYFSVAYEDGDLFILTWRRTSDAKPLPDRMLSILELKRSGVLHFPFTERFMKLLTHGEVSVPRSEEDDQLVHSLSDFETVREVFEDDLDRVFRSELLPVVPTRASRILLLRILNATKTALQTADLNEVSGVQREKSDNVRLFENLSRRDLKAHLVRFSREVLSKEYQAEVGPALARLSQRCDERVSFAASYPMWAKCT